MEQYITPGFLVDHRYKKQYKEKALISAATPIGAVYDRIPANNYNYHSMESGERTRKMLNERYRDGIKQFVEEIQTERRLQQIWTIAKRWAKDEKREGENNEKY